MAQPPPFVMAGLVPAIHALRPRACVAAWMPATSAGMTGAYPATSGKTAPSFTTPITKFDSMAAMHLRRVSRVLTKRS
ncbi:hypothetical protein Ga0061061_101115 [Chelatococcus sambhunathii]|uniref:Secreted protein n=1 Tax=Chelatococcus sambhunathii TaxID=363953 RepID=A0ABP2A399_9HYPH|nr:hypothetical protein Ga0061061_101115 [Chelatococcus sambhunathii]